MDYRSIGLNQFLQPINSPITNAGAVDGYQFDGSYESNIIRTTSVRDNAITNRKITSVSVDKLTAGTILVSVNLGTSSGGTLILDGSNNRMVGHDGTTNRWVLGDV